MPRTSTLSSHNERKLSVLLALFDKFMTVGDTAKATLPASADCKVHKNMTKLALSRLRWRYPNPYVTHKDIKVERSYPRGNSLKTVRVYKCLAKGRKMACELLYRKTHGLNLKNDKTSRSIYNIYCDDNGCKDCKFNPKKYF